MTEHLKAKAWRERLGLSYDELADLTGYSPLAIRYFEKGVTPERTAKHIAGKQKSKPVRWYIWKRYRMICAGVTAQLTSGKEFQW